MSRPYVEVARDGTAYRFFFDWAAVVYPPDTHAAVRDAIIKLDPLIIVSNGTVVVDGGVGLVEGKE